MEMFMKGFLYNVRAVMLLRVIVLINSPYFNNLFAYYDFKFGPVEGTLKRICLKTLFHFWDWHSVAQYLALCFGSAVIFFIFVNSNKLWCTRLR